MSANLKIGNNNNFVTSTSCKIFLGMTMNETLSWDNHIEVLARKLSMACYIIRNTKTYMSTSPIKIIYHVFFQSLMNYGIIFWGYSPHSATNFAYRKKAIRIMERCGNRVSYRDLFKKLHSLPLTSQYLLSLLMFVVQHKELFITSIESHNIETRQSNNLYIPRENLFIYQEGDYYSGTKIFNKLPSNIKNINGNIAKLKTTLKNIYTRIHSTY
jgi:hypothetical protein